MRRNTRHIFGGRIREAMLNAPSSTGNDVTIEDSASVYKAEAGVENPTVPTLHSTFGEVGEFPNGEIRTAIQFDISDFTLDYSQNNLDLNQSEFKLSFDFVSDTPSNATPPLSTDNQGILLNNGTETTLYDLENRTSANPVSNGPGVIEIGEASGVELRGYLEFGILDITPATTAEVMAGLYDNYYVNLDILDQGGSGTTGDGSANNLGNSYTGRIDIYWYPLIPAALEAPYTFNPILGDPVYQGNIGLEDVLNPVYSFQVDGLDPALDNYSIGDTVRIDVSRLLRMLLIEPWFLGFDPYSGFGLMIQASDISADAGQCGIDGQRTCGGILLNNVEFLTNNKAYPIQNYTDNLLVTYHNADIETIDGDYIFDPVTDPILNPVGTIDLSVYTLNDTLELDVTAQVSSLIENNIDSITFLFKTDLINPGSCGIGNSLTRYSCSALTLDNLNLKYTDTTPTGNPGIIIRKTPEGYIRIIK